MTPGATSQGAGLHPISVVEVTWSWRRWVTIGVLIACFSIAGAVVWRLQEPGALKAIGLAALGFGSFAHLLYLVGPTATDLARILGSVHLQLGALRLGEASQHPIGVGSDTGGTARVGGLPSVDSAARRP